jgi:hypothetical protein
MDQYFPPENIDFLDVIDTYIFKDKKLTPEINQKQIPVLDYSRPDNSMNYYVYSLVNYITDVVNKKFTEIKDVLHLLTCNHNSTTVVGPVNDKEYLNILLSSVVFVEYIDCSASNTILECIATCTPIIVNRHPAIVEYLGNDYPLYHDNIYNSHNDTYELTSSNLMKSHNYLYRIRVNNSKLHLDNFIDSLKTIIKH